MNSIDRAPRVVLLDNFPDHLRVVGGNIGLNKGHKQVNFSHRLSYSKKQYINPKFQQINKPIKTVQIQKNMQHAKQIILQTTRSNNLKYYLSQVQKQNDTGIFNNQRLLFLCEAQHLGYLSKVNINERIQDINFEKTKMNVLLINIKKVKKIKDQLVVEFSYVKDFKNVERNWILKYASDILCKRWYDLILKEQAQAVRRKEEMERPKPPVVRVEESINTYEPEKKPLVMVSRNMELAEKVERERVLRDAATSVSPRHQQQEEKIEQVLQKEREKKERERINSEMQLSRIMNGGSKVKVDEAFTEKDRQLRSKQDDPTAISQNKEKEKSIRSQPLFLKTHEYSQHLGSSGKGLSSSHSKHNETPEANKKEVRWQDGESPVHDLNNKKYLQPGDSNANQGDYYERVTQMIQRSPIVSNRSASRRTTPGVEREEYPYQRQHERLSHPYAERKLYMPETGPYQPWTFKYIKHNHLMFGQFKNYAEELMKEIVPDLQQSLDHRKFKAKLIKNNIAYFDVQDVQVKVSLVTLDGGEDGARRVASKMAIKMLQNEFNDYRALYEYLGDSLQLRVPLVCLCEYKGFLALFKLLSRNAILHITKSLRTEITNLQQRSKIKISFNENINRVLIQLDQKYYSQYKTIEDLDLNFNVYFIQEIDHYMLPDLTQGDLTNMMPLRKELVEGYEGEVRAIGNQLNQDLKLREPFLYQEYHRELMALVGELRKVVENAALQIDSLQIYFMNSKDVSEFLHGKGINLRYLGNLYSLLTTTYQKRIIMSEMASRSCKTLFRKTIQDILIEESYQGDEDNFHNKICDFLNCILGSSHQTAEMWQVLTAHCQAYFGVQIDYGLIDRWFFIVSLVENCRLELDWNRVVIEEAFKTNSFFSAKNLKGLKVQNKMYPPLYSEYYHLTRQVLDGEQSRQNFNRLISYLSLRKQPIPEHLEDYKYQINKYLAFFISPQQAKEAQYKHLHIYSTYRLLPSRSAFELMLVEIKWHLKLKAKESYIRSCNQFIKNGTKYYGEFHPIFSQLYDVFSAYHLDLFHFEDAITFAKSSLVNILKLCGTNHEKTSECYYHLALCYTRANRSQQASTHLAKALHYFQNGAKQYSVAYGIMSLKLSTVSLNLNEIENAIKNAERALRVLEGQDAVEFQEEVTECFEVLARCYQIRADKESIQLLAQKCLGRLNNITQAQHLEKMLKIYLYPVLSGLDVNTASVLINFLSTLNPNTDKNTQQISFTMLRKRLQQDSLNNNLETYLSRASSIEQHIRERQIMQEWNYLQEVYPRETVKDFISLMSELTTLLGDNFLVGALRESL